MSVITVEKNTAKVDPLYQWDLNQELVVYGLSLPTIPEVHFCHQDMGAAIVRQATMDAAGVIRADIPNSLLQKPYKLYAYVCIYEGSTFKTLYKFEIPVKPRAKPADYTLEDDPEVYSFNALENRVVNALAACAVAETLLADATTAQEQAAADYAAAKQDVEAMVDAAVEEVKAAAYTRNETLTDDTKTLFGLDASAVPDDVFALIQATMAGHAAVAVGSYTGTGATTSPTLTFTAPPKLLIVAPAAKQSVSVTNFRRGIIFEGVGWLDIAGKDAVFMLDLTVTVEGNSISWTPSGQYPGGLSSGYVAAVYALNVSGVEYYYAAVLG